MVHLERPILHLPSSLFRLLARAPCCMGRGSAGVMERPFPASAGAPASCRGWAVLLSLLLAGETLLSAQGVLAQLPPIACTGSSILPEDEQALLGMAAFWRSSPSTWRLGRKCSDWEGVLCNSCGQVIALSLPNYGLMGSISPSVGNLSNLNTLNLSVNRLFGTLPSTMSRLSNLTSLNLQVNNISGPISYWMSSLVSLVHLNLSSNLFDNRVHPNLGRLTRLLSLDLNYLGLSGSMPSSIGSPIRLTRLALDNNQITGTIPQNIGKLTDLRNLTMWANPLSGPIPFEIGSLENLQQMNLSYLGLNGSIPSSIGGLVQLRRMNLSYNELNENIPAAIGDLSNLQSLSVSHNNLEGAVPSYIGNLTDLTYLDLSYNELTGEIPSDFWKLTNMVLMHLNNNWLSGPLPTSLGILKNLQSLSLDSNDISGPIPSGIGNATQLSSLSLGFNQLDGTLPSELSLLENLQALVLGGNKISGSISSSLGSLGQLNSLDLSQNRFSGEIDGLIAMAARLPLLSSLDLNSNKFSGSLPNAISSLTKLTLLRLAANSIFGLVPSSIALLTNLKRLNLGRNLLVGTLPSLTGLTNLQFLLVNGNFFVGTSPHVPLTTAVDISYNFFSALPVPCARMRLTNGGLQGNCLNARGSHCGLNQRTRQACGSFCSASSITIQPCSGRGFCYQDPTTEVTQCLCEAPFVADPFHPKDCITAGSLPPPPPPRVPFQQGISQTAPASLARLNRHSRHLSAFFSLSNAVPSWDIQAVSAWMAPSQYFLGSTQGTSGGGILSWGAVQDQGACAAAWAVPVADAVAAAVAAAASPDGGNVTSLAWQQLVACSARSLGCQGGYPTSALDYTVQSGLLPASDFNASTSCNATTDAVPPQVVMYEAVQFRGWFGLLLTLQFQPALVILDGSSEAFQNPICFEEFVFSVPSCNTGSLGHSVLVVGYDLAALVPYWLIRNSWGPDWCTGGYMRLAIQGGEGTCGMNILPAYYPVPAPPAGDPCYMSSTVPDGDTTGRPSLLPCGGGSCSPSPQWGPYSYSCDCSRLGEFVAANNTVAIDLPGAGLGITQACVPVDACSLALRNPCQVGTCVNDGRGDYTCICPPGFTQGLFVTGSQTCIYGDTGGSASLYTVQPGVNCALIAGAYQLSLSSLKAQNPMLNCTLNPLPAGSLVSVTNAAFSCSATYAVTKSDGTCSDIVDKLSQVSVLSLVANNPGADCNNLSPGQSLCLRGGSWMPPAVCSQSYTLTSTDSCLSVIQDEAPSAAELFALNPGLNCDGLVASGLPSALALKGNTVCVERGAAVGPINCTAVPPVGLYDSYSLQLGDTCDSLVRNRSFNFNTFKQVEEINSPISSFRCSVAALGQTICYPLQ